MSRRRVVVTGLGIVSPLGNTVAETWNGVVAGKSGITLIDEYDTSSFSSRIAGAIRNFDVTQFMLPKEAKRVDSFIHYGLAACIEAMQDSGIEVTEQLAPRFGTAIGSGIGGISTIEKNHKILLKSGPRKISPFFVPGTVNNMVAGNISIRYGLQGPNFTLTTACTTGTHSIGFAGRCIAYGDADVMIAGGAEKGSSPLGLAGFAAARALSTRNDDPQAASRPWDRDRDGFVLSDGAGALVLEEYEHAKARGADIYAELVGFGMSGDAHHITSPPDDGGGARRAMENALNDAHLSTDKVDYINAHGTSTPLGDVVETVAVKALFGDHAKKLTISSTKSMMGHLLGAAGAVEGVITVLAIKEKIAPPTINLDNPGEGCDLDYVPHEARTQSINTAISNSFGFGGTNATLVFKEIS